MTISLPEPVRSFFERVNAHDEQGFLDAFTEQGVVDDWGREFTGRDAIKGWSDKEFIGARGTFTAQKVTTDAQGRVSVVGEWRSSYANGPSAFTFDVDGGRVARMAIREG